eukprot:760810-Hanusia_phi.AAC.2
MPNGITAVRDPSYPFKSWRGMDWKTGGTGRTWKGEGEGERTPKSKGDWKQDDASLFDGMKNLQETGGTEEARAGGG